MPSENAMSPEIPDELVEQFATGTASVFVGAGASLAAGLPTWAELLEPLRHPIANDSPDGLTFLDVAQFYENEFRRARLTEQIRGRLETWNRQPTNIHLSLVRLLREGRIYTTNLDDLLEKAADQSGLLYRVITNTDPLISFAPNRLTIVKLHGTVDQVNSYVVTAQDYESYFRKHPGLTRVIGTEFQVGTVLFVGYSHSDIDLRMILRRITDEGGQFSRPHYTLQLNPKKAVVKDLERRVLHVISIDCKPDVESCTTAVADWLTRLHAKVRASVGAGTPNATASGARQNHNFPVAAHSRLFGRDADIQTVFAALAIPGISMVSIEGFAGVGKTALAYDVGLACVSPHGPEPNFDFAVWIQANKPDQKLWFQEIMNTLAVTLTGEPYASTRSYSSDKYDLVRDKAVLIIINSYEKIDDEELTDWIVHLPEPNRVIITTQRAQPANAERCTHISLNGLSTIHSIDLARDHARSLGLVKLLQDRDISALASVSEGNPQVIKLALGLVSGGTISLPEVVGELLAVPNRRVHDNLLHALFDRSWILLSDDAKRILMISTLLVGTSVIRLNALFEISEIEQNDFDRALDQLLKFKLLESAYDGRFITHALTRELAGRKLEERPELRNRAMKACVTHLLTYVERSIRRETPSPPYWNALVSERMADIDAEWSCIQAAIGWASDEELVQFIMLLAHYLDSRFLNTERLKYMTRALDVLSASDRKSEEALLRIDGISWTLVETDQVPRALEEINKGLEIAREYTSGADRDELIALGSAWKARVIVELDRPTDVTGLLNIATDLPCRPWIKHRVHTS
ncbi:MAG: SIR2 family protein [Bryobacteraceae bacterium]